MKRTRKANRHQSTSANLDFQTLEPRNLLAGISFDTMTGIVTIEGSSGADRVQIVNASPDHISVDFQDVGNQVFNTSQVEEIVFYGHAGNDRFRNETSVASQAFGHEGDDVLSGGNKSDQLHGGDGNDRLHGNDGDDLLTGGGQDDTISGGAGNDRIEGMSGNDRIFGRDGNDDVFAGSGDDFVNGGRGNDGIHGHDGNDQLKGGSGDDSIEGNVGNDLIRGSKGNDSLSGNAGRDQLFGGLDNDLIYGGSESDGLYGNRGRDDLFGGEANDDLYGGHDADKLIGNGGNDDYYPDSFDQIFDDSQDSSSNGDFEIRGEITNLNSDNRSFQVLGINVSYSNAEFVANIQNGSFVKVEGAYNGSVLNAHEVENEFNDDRDENFEARGIITELNTTAQTFRFFGFNVNYSNADIDGQPVNGTQVSVEGRLTGSNILAFRLETSGANGDSNGGNNGGGNNGGSDATNGDIELRGSISNLNLSAHTFSLFGLTVDFSTAQLPGNFDNGSFVKVDGRYDGNRIDAREVEIEIEDDRDENIEVQGVIENLNTDSQTFQFLGFTVHFESASIETPLENGSSVEVEGLFSNGMILAAEIR